MSLADDLLAPIPPPTVIRCRVALLLQRLDAQDPEGAAALRSVLASEMPGTVIVQRLQNAGIDLTIHALWRHRRGTCRCPR
jgi:hypothetical protein